MIQDNKIEMSTTDEINEAPSPAPDPFIQELDLHATAYARQWSPDRPWYARRSEIDRTLLILGTSCCTNTNSNATIAKAKNLHALGDEYVVMRDGFQLIRVSKHLGRTYRVRYLRIIDGKILRLWVSTHDASEDVWRNARSRIVRLSNESPNGYVVVS
jgi:hypothetical protein